MKLLLVLGTLVAGSGVPTMLKAEEKCRLLQIARESIECSFTHRPVAADPGTSKALSDPRGAFVTLRSGGSLRGCIGYFETDMPLISVVCEVARKAAFEDPRFPPLTQPEFGIVDLEISVLSELIPLKDPVELQIGVHGLLIECGPNRGLLLPQVAKEQAWTAEKFLEAVAGKAGLEMSAWKDPRTGIWSFTAEVIRETRKSDNA